MKTIRFFITILGVYFISNNIILAQSKHAEIIKAYYSAVDAGDMNNTQKTLASDFTASLAIAPTPFDTEGLMMVLKGFKTAFPDMKHEVTDWFADGKKIAVKGVFKGTNTGINMENPPTNNKVATPFNTIFELNDNGKIKSINSQFDLKSFEAQLMAGMITPDQIKKNCWAAFDALNRRDYESFKRTVSSDFIDYTAGVAPISGVDACIEAYKQFFASAPDMTFEINTMTFERDRLIVETTTTGTNTGMVMGMLPASSKKIKIKDVDILTIDLKTGKATSHMSANPNALLHQIGYGSLSNPNTHIVLDVYKKFGKGDIGGIIALCADNIIWDAQVNPSPGAARYFVGAKGIPDFFAAIAKSVDVTKFEPTRFVADGDDVFTSINVGYKLKASTKVVEVPFIHHFKFENGKISALRELVGTSMADMIAKK